jgi:ArsR family transcriptional regulator, arsenate/arsenite/antimonite-responsive transcriptional repressor
MSDFPCCTSPKERKEIQRTAEFLRVVGDANRLRILCLLQEGERCVCEIWQALDLPQNLTSHHLGVLKEQGLLRSRKKGLKVYYAINKKKLHAQCAPLLHYLWRPHHP